MDARGAVCSGRESAGDHRAKASADTRLHRRVFCMARLYPGRLAAASTNARTIPSAGFTKAELRATRVAFVCEIGHTSDGDVEKPATEAIVDRAALRLAAIVDSSEDAIVSKDLNGVVQTWNGAAERMFGYTASEIVGRPISLIIPRERLSEEDEVLARVRSGRGIDHFETVRQRKDGSLVEISLTVSPIKDADGTVIGASKIARDITLQRRILREAEEANRVKDEFLAMLSHELRTPLNAVMGYMRMLRLGHVGEGGQERVIEIVERNTRILSQLVSDVLDVSSIVTGKIRMKVTSSDLRQGVEAALDVVRPTAAAKGVVLEVDIPLAPVMSLCDADRIQQVFWNLLSNAVKFTPRGGRVSVRLVRQELAATLTVSDTGIGIRPESLPYVFQRFWQEGSSQGRQGGLGLGLALARHFVELHGGTISVESLGEGQGATFEVTLPIANG